MLVIDASVALKWFKEEPDSLAAENAALADTPIAPELIVAEVANAAWTAARRGLLLGRQVRGRWTPCPATLPSCRR